MTLYVPPPASPATGKISSAGIGSGLDVAGIVKKLVAADTQNQTHQISRQQGTVKSELSAVGQIKSAASALDDAIGALSKTGIGARTASVSDTNVLTATASSGATFGVHTVEVQSLATAQILTSQAFASADTRVGSGTLTVGVGDKSFDVDLAGGATLAQVRDAINAAPDNAGVNATIITAGDGAHLMLSSNATGTSHAIKVTASGGDGGLLALHYGDGTSGGLSQYQAASDAQLVVDGYAVTSASNTVSGVVEGLTLNLTQAAPGESVTVAIKQDQDATSGAVADFVSAYNALVSAITKQTRYDSSSGTAAPLLGNISITMMSQRLRDSAGSALPSNAFTTLSQIGINSSTDGTLTLDGDALSSALAANTGAVAQLLTGSSGVATRIQAQLADSLGIDGVFSIQTTAFQSQLSTLDQQQQALDARTARLTQMYTAQFSALDGLMSQLQSTSSYLTQALAALPTIGGNRSGN